MLLSVVSWWGAATAGTLFPLGAYLQNPNGSDPSAEALFEGNEAAFAATMHAAPALIVAYVDYTQPVSAWVANASWQAWSNAQSAVARGMVPVIGLPMASIAPGSADADTQYRAFAAGSYDAVLAGIVTAWTGQGFHQLYLRPGWEMNIAGNTYVGDSAAARADWVAAFRHIYRVLHAAASGADASLQVVWNPSATSYTSVHATSELYPGDASVDVVGVDMYADMYPFTDGNSQYHDWDTGGEDATLAQFMADPVNRRHYWSWPAATQWSLDGSEGHSQSFTSLSDFAGQHGKPFAVVETGAGSSQSGHDVTDDAAFPTWLYRHLSAARGAGLTIAFVDIWDANADGNYEYSRPGDGKPWEAKAWSQYFGD